MADLDQTATDGPTMLLIAHELDRASQCRRWAARWDGPMGPIWDGEWSSRDWKDSARGHIALARKLREATNNAQS